MSLQRRLYASPLWHLPFEAMEELMVIYRLMKAKIAETDNPFRKGALLGYTQVLIYNCYKYLLAADSGNEKTEVKSGRQQELYTQFMDEVRKSYIKERSISYYADVLCVTPKYLSQVVRRVSGRFAGDWITDFVILEAKAFAQKAANIPCSRSPICSTSPINPSSESISGRRSGVRRKPIKRMGDNPNCFDCSDANTHSLQMRISTNIRSVHFSVFFRYSLIEEMTASYRETLYSSSAKNHLRKQCLDTFISQKYLYLQYYIELFDSMRNRAIPNALGLLIRCPFSCKNSSTSLVMKLMPPVYLKDTKKSDGIKTELRTVG